MFARSMKILFIVNVDWFLVSHRLPIAQEALKKGYEVHVATAFTNKKNFLINEGFKLHEISFKRSDSGIVSFFKDLIKIIYLYIKIKPNIVHLITIKPVIIGLLASYIVPRSKFVASISGLGYIFSSNSLKALIKRYVITFLYKICFSRKDLKVIFQTKNDRDILMKIKSLKTKNIYLIPGSGVDLIKLKPLEKVPASDTVLFASRLLFSKGIKEYIEAAKIVKNIKFLVAGEIDPNNIETISKEDIQIWSKIKNVEFIGYQNQMQEIINKCSIVVLPSYYGEGIPKILIEAAACGRPIITTNHPGCRDAIIPGITGLLVPKKNSNELSKTIVKLLKDRDLRITMGIAARQLALKKYSIREVVNNHMQIYRELLF